MNDVMLSQSIAQNRVIADNYNYAVLLHMFTAIYGGRLLCAFPEPAESVVILAVMPSREWE